MEAENAEPGHVPQRDSGKWVKEQSETSSDKSVSLRKSMVGVKKKPTDDYAKDIDKDLDSGLYIKTPV